MRSSRALLTCAAIGALSGLLVIGLSPVTSALALLSPPLYALVASVHMLGPLLAAAWFRRPGAATLTALVSGLVALAATTLGPLLVLALVVPAAVMDLVLWAAGRRRDRVDAWVVTGLVGGAVIAAITIPVIDGRLLSPALVALVAGARLLAVTAVALGARALAGRLSRAGLRPPPA